MLQLRAIRADGNYIAKIIWYAYDKNNMFELPVKFSFESMESFGEAITAGILHVNFFTGRSHQPSYKFYYSLVAARQLSFGQVPSCFFFTDRVKPRDTVSDRLKNLILLTWRVELSYKVLCGVVQHMLQLRAIRAYGNYMHSCSCVVFIGNVSSITLKRILSFRNIK